MDDVTFEYVVRSCIEDSRLLDIVRSVARMSKNEKEGFSKKVLMYFMDKSSDEDREAYKFFKFILQDNNASKILERVKKHERSEG